MGFQSSRRGQGRTDEGLEAGWGEIDASTYLEEMVVGSLAPLTGAVRPDSEHLIELVGPHLRLSGTVLIGGHPRLSDFLVHHQGLIELHDATVLRRNGDPTRVTAGSIWVNPAEVTIIGDLESKPSPQTKRGMTQPRVRHPLVVVTTGHTLTGEVYLPPEGELSVFIASPYPPYIPLTKVRTRSLADRRVRTGYDFVLLNRNHIVAAAGLEPGVVTGRNAI